MLFYNGNNVGMQPACSSFLSNIGSFKTQNSMELQQGGLIDIYKEKNHNLQKVIF